MEIILNRIKLTHTETVGELIINGVFHGYTLEDAVRISKIKSITAIPSGEYKVRVTHSPRFKKRLPLVYNNDKNLTIEHGKDSWAGIRFHGGSHHGHTDGCVLLGSQLHTTPKSFTQNGLKHTIENWLSGSTEPMNRLVKLLDNGQTHELIITEPEYYLTEPYMRGAGISLLQRAINEYYVKTGLDSQRVLLNEDGIYGPKTSLEVSYLQYLAELSITGRARKPYNFFI